MQQVGHRGEGPAISSWTQRRVVLAAPPPFLRGVRTDREVCGGSEVRACGVDGLWNLRPEVKPSADGRAHHHDPREDSTATFPPQIEAAAAQAVCRPLRHLRLFGPSFGAERASPLNLRPASTSSRSASRDPVYGATLLLRSRRLRALAADGPHERSRAERSTRRATGLHRDRSTDGSAWGGWGVWRCTCTSARRREHGGCSPSTFRGSGGIAEYSPE